MKYWAIIIVVLVLTGCQSERNQGGVKLTGNAENLAEGGYIHLEIITQNGPQKIDTLDVDSEGNFIAYVDVEEPSFYRINFNGRQIVTLILNGEETEVTLNAHGNDPRGFKNVSGSYDTEFKNQMDLIMQAFQSERSQYQQQQLKARQTNDAALFNEVNSNLYQLVERTEKELKQLISEASPSLAAIYGIQMIDQEKNAEFLESVAVEMREVMPDNFHVVNLLQTVNAKKTLAIGAAAPELSLPNPDGEVINLSSLKGKYVLIDFWAAWCRPCRAENPNVVRVYNKYAGENFEILGVSLDKTKGAWIGAIEQDGLPWLHVSDLKFWNSIAARTYQIHSIPATYLIDPEGKIIAKNLRGPSLEAKLKEIFG